MIEGPTNNACTNCEYFETQLRMLNHALEPVYVERHSCLHPESKYRPIFDGEQTPMWCAFGEPAKAIKQFLAQHFPNYAYKYRLAEDDCEISVAVPKPVNNIALKITIH